MSGIGMPGGFGGAGGRGGGFGDDDMPDIGGDDDDDEMPDLVDQTLQNSSECVKRFEIDKTIVNRQPLAVEESGIGGQCCFPLVLLRLFV